MTSCQNKCFLSLVLKALALKRKLNLYNLEKECAKAGNENIKECSCVKLSECTNLSKFHCPNPKPKKNGFFNRFLDDDTMENFILKSVLGFIGGILLTYICFMFLVFSLNFTLKRATYICMGLGVILSLGLAFSVKIRCTVFLCIPQLFSKRGRQALLAYAFILALSGPAKNTLHNVEVMSESLACGQEQLKQAENELLKYVQKPNAAAKKSIEKLLEKINSAVKYYKNFIMQFYRTYYGILETILHAQKWLYSISLLCYKKMGKPKQRCRNLLSESSKNCESISDWSGWKEICSVKPEVKKLICPRNEKAFCLKSDVPQSLPVPRLQNQLDAFKRRAMNIIYVKVDAHHTYSQTNKSNTYHEEYQGMATEIRQKTDQFLQYFDFMSVIFGIFILVLFAKVIIYRHRFLTEDHYDNRYITSDFVDIDNVRGVFRMETLLPLEPREKMKYIKVASFRLVPFEKIQLVSSFVFLVFATFKIIIHILTDSSLYWILSTVRREERLLYWNTIKEEEPSITVKIVGDGVAAALFRNVTKAVKRQSTQTRLDPTPCLPDPVAPDWNRYYQILALVLICWLLALCEPYGLRLRHTVMVTYHPDRARERAIWLYNRIISSRSSFFKTARREIRRKYKDYPADVTSSFQFMKKKTSLKCLLCKINLHTLDNFVKCPTTSCVGLFCGNCFVNLKYCSICRDSAEYGDFRGLSEERDSSEEENSCKCGKKKAKQNCFPKRIQSGENTKSNTNTNLSFLINLRKPQLNFKTGFENCQEKKGSRKNLLQPTLLVGAVNYCLDKFLPFKKGKNLSDLESSDWDFDTSFSTEEGTPEQKSINTSRLSRKCAKYSEIIKKEAALSNSSRKWKKPRKNSKITAKHGQGISKHKRIEKASSRVAIRLFRKVTPPKMLAMKESISRHMLKSDVPFRNLSLREVTKKPIPDFLFRKIVQGAERNFSNPKPDAFARVKDSVQVIRTKITGAKCVPNISSGVSLATSKSGDSTSIEIKSELTPIDDTSSLNRLMDVRSAKLGDLAVNSPGHASGIFPFIDPFTIHQFSSILGLTENVPPREASPLSMKEVVPSKVKGAKPKVNLTPGRVRLCLRENDSSGSDDIGICVRDTSSSESESQFYSEPHRPFETALKPEEENPLLKRTSAKLELREKCGQRFSSMYSVETDSSNDQFMSVKPTGRLHRKEKIKYKRSDEESDIPIKKKTNLNSGKVLKKVDFLKAKKKIVEGFKENMAERKSSEEGGTSDIDDIEYMPNSTVFLSDEEFQKISKRLSNKSVNFEDCGEKCSQLSWAPDLISDLPKLKDSENSAEKR